MSRVWTPPGLQVVSLTLALAGRSSSFVYPASGCDLRRRGPSWWVRGTGPKREAV